MAIYDGAEEESEGEQIIMDIKINVGEYVRISTKDDRCIQDLLLQKEQLMQMVGYMNFTNSIQFMKMELPYLITR